MAMWSFDKPKLRLYIAMFKKLSTHIVVALCAIFILLTGSQKLTAGEEKPIQLTLDQADSKNPWLPSGSISAFRYDKYLANRVNRVITEQPTMQYEINLEWPCGFYLMWLEVHGTNDSDWSTDASDETQAAIGYGWYEGPYKFKLQATTINLHPIERWFDHDRIAFELYISRTWKFKGWGDHSVTPEFRVGWFADTQSIKKGVPILMPALYHRWNSPFGLECLSIQSRFCVAWDGGFKSNDPDGIFFQAESGFHWKLDNKKTLILPGIKTFVPLTHNINDGRQDNSNTFFTGMKIAF